MAEYERRLALQWSTVNEEPATQTVRTRARLIPRLPFDADTAARAAWRNNEPPQETFTMPANFVPVERSDPKSRSRGRARARAESSSQASPEIAGIAYETQTEIQVGLPQGKNREVRVSIWGESENAALALSKLEQWVGSYHKNTKIKDWSKVVNNNPERRKAYEAKLRAEDEKAKYRKAAPAGVIFPAIGIFEWRANYDPPEDILGRNLEACDSIRTKFSCFVTLDPMQKILKVCADNPQNVRQAVKRLRGAFFQAVARDRASTSQPKFLLTKTKGIDPEAQVEMTLFLDQNKQGSRTTLSDQEGRTVIGARPHLRDYVSHDARHYSSVGDVAALHKVVERALPTLQNFQGNLEMCIRLGTFVLRKFRRGEHTFEDFQVILEDDEVDGAVYTETDVTGEVMLERLEHDREMLLPGSGDYDRPESLNIRPTYAATFLIYVGGEKLMFKLDVKFVYNEVGHVDCVSRVWSRLPSADPTVMLKTLDICLIDLSNCSAWNVEIKSFDTVNESRNPSLIAFGDSVTLDLATAEDKSSEKTFINYKPQPGVGLISLVQKTIYSVEYQHSTYMLDLSLNREFRLANPNERFANQMSLTGYEPRWKVEVYRKDWDVVFAENAILETGETMSSKIDVARLFPAQNGGLPSFVDILDRFRACLREGK